VEPAARALKLDDQQFRQAARRRLEEQAHRVETETKVSPDIHVAEGKPFAEIAARCAAAGADLLVVGTHGENFLLDPFLGTTAHRVLRFAAVPILLAKKASASPYELALDGQSYLVIRWLSIPVQ
jgi:nucleotide-binding universal stress UspA family protein